MNDAELAATVHQHMGRLEVSPLEHALDLARAVRAAERERCAKVCERVASDLESAEEDAQAMSIGAQSCADQIRAGA